MKHNTFCSVRKCIFSLILSRENFLFCKKKYRIVHALFFLHSLHVRCERKGLFSLISDGLRGCTADRVSFCRCIRMRIRFCFCALFAQRSSQARYLHCIVFDVPLPLRAGNLCSIPYPCSTLRRRFRFFLLWRRRNWREIADLFCQKPVEEFTWLKKICV